MLRCISAPNIYIYTYVHEHTPLAKPGLCSGGRISCKPNTDALLSTIINKMMTVKVLIIVHCLVPVLIAIILVHVLARYGYTSVTTSSNHSNIHSTISYKCYNDSNNGTNKNNMN